MSESEKDSDASSVAAPPPKSKLFPLFSLVIGACLGLGVWGLDWQLGPMFGPPPEVENYQGGIAPDPVAAEMLVKANARTERNNLMYRYAVLAGLLSFGLVWTNPSQGSTTKRLVTSVMSFLIAGALGAAVAPLAIKMISQATSEAGQIAGQVAVLACIGAACGTISRCWSGSIKTIGSAILEGGGGGAIAGMLFFVIASLLFPYAKMTEPYSTQAPVSALWSAVAGACIALGIGVGDLTRSKRPSN